MTQRWFFSQASSHRSWLLEVLSQVRWRPLKSLIMTALPRQVLCAVFKHYKKTSFGTSGDKYNETTCICATDSARSWYFSVATLENTEYRMRGWIFTATPPWPRQPRWDCVTETDSLTGSFAGYLGAEATSRIHLECVHDLRAEKPHTPCHGRHERCTSRP